MHAHRITVIFFSVIFLITASLTFYQLYNYPVGGTGSTAAPQQTQNMPKNPEFVPGEVIVKLKAPIVELDKEDIPVSAPPGRRGSKLKPAELDKSNLPKKLVEVNSKYKVKTIEKTFPTAKTKARNTDKEATAEQKSVEDDLARIYTLSVEANSPVDKIVNELVVDSGVEYAEPNYIVYPTLIPNDTYFPLNSSAFNQWALENHGRPNSSIFRVDSDIDAIEAWNIQRGSPTVYVAVIDSGIDYTHPDLGGGFGSTKKVVTGYDFVNKDADPKDDYGHGTHIAGIIAASGNDKRGIIGVCPECRLIAVKIFDAEGRGNISNISEGIMYAVNKGAKIINLSLGTYTKSETMRLAVKYATGREKIVVASAGNNNNSTKVYPAAFDKVLAVASTDYKDIKAGSSSYDDGTGWVDISAPGTFILSTALQSGKACTVAQNPHETKVARYAYCSGTSMAAPFVAGVAALMFSGDKYLKMDDLIYLIKLNTDNIDAYNPSYKGKLGKGRLNAHYAVSKNALWCSDSDWGLNPGVKGYTTSNSVLCKGASGHDSCVDGKKLLDRTCSPNSPCRKNYYVCPGKCLDGVCVK